MSISPSRIARIKIPAVLAPSPISSPADLPKDDQADGEATKAEPKLVPIAVPSDEVQVTLDGEIEITGPSRSPVTATATLTDILPPRTPFAGFATQLGQEVPEWIPIENYNPATSPSGIPTKIFMPLESNYTSTLPRLPPTSSIAGRRKRRGSKTEERKRDLHALQLEFRSNPISDSLHKSTKCVLTGDWRVAEAELRYIRTVERVDEKQNANKWSLRQPKKLRGPPVPKSHHDYLLDEMVSFQCQLLLG